jgi:hypothetical protein
MEENASEGNWITMGKDGKIVRGDREKTHLDAVTTQVTNAKNNPINQATGQNRSNAGKITEYPNPDSVDENVATRQRRTVRATFTPNQGPYGRHSFSAHLINFNILNHLETCGATAQKNTFTLTFDTISAAQKFREAGDFVTGEGVTCRVDPGRDGIRFAANGKTRATVKCHWVPYHVDMANALKTLETMQGVKIKGARYDTVRNDPLLKDVSTGIRTVWLEVDNPNDIPHKIEWRQGLQSGTALITVFGRAVPCFRCWKDGHNRAECKEPKCDRCRQIGHFTDDCKGLSYAAKAQAKQNERMDLENENMELNIEDLDEAGDSAGLKINRDHAEATKGSTCTTREQDVESGLSSDDTCSGGAEETIKGSGPVRQGGESGSGQQTKQNTIQPVTPHQTIIQDAKKAVHVGNEWKGLSGGVPSEPPGGDSTASPNKQADDSTLTHPSCFSQEDDSTGWETSLMESDEETSLHGSDLSRAYSPPTQQSTPTQEPTSKLPKRKRILKGKNPANEGDNSSTETVKESKKPKQGKKTTADPRTRPKGTHHATKTNLSILQNPQPHKRHNGAH